MKNELSKYRIQEAKERILSAEILLKSKQYKDSVSRTYYAMFSAARALLATKGYDSAKHSGVISLFNQYFTKEKVVSTDMGRLLAEVKDARERGDYGDYIIVAEEEAQKYLEMAKTLCEGNRKRSKKSSYKTDDCNLFIFSEFRLMNRFNCITSASTRI